MVYVRYGMTAQHQPVQLMTITNRYLAPATKKSFITGTMRYASLLTASVDDT